MCFTVISMCSEVKILNTWKDFLTGNIRINGNLGSFTTKSQPISKREIYFISWHNLANTAYYATNGVHFKTGGLLKNGGYLGGYLPGFSIGGYGIFGQWQHCIETKHVQMFVMICSNVSLNIRLSFEFGITHRTICNVENLKVILAMSFCSSLFYWDQRSLGWSSLYPLSLSFVCFQIQN